MTTATNLTRMMGDGEMLNELIATYDQFRLTLAAGMLLSQSQQVAEDGLRMMLDTWAPRLPKATP